MTAAELAFAPLSVLREKLDQGAITAVQLTESCLARIEAHDQVAKAFILISDDTARQRARAVDRGHISGPLAGIAHAVKDLFDVAGNATTGGSAVLADNIANSDAHVISCMSDAGAICLGKLNLHEFAYGATGENAQYGTARNVWDPSRLAGGSSSGSAAAVAYGMIPAAFGTDTGGSVRVPAALSGLVGLKPTSGRISTRGVIPFSWSADHVGTLTRHVEDAAVLLGTVAGHDPQDPSSSREPVDDYHAACNGNVSGVRIGIPETFFFEDCEPEIIEASEKAIRHLEQQGARIVPVTLPDLEHARTVALTIQMPEALSYHSRYLDDRGDLYSTEFRAGLALGQCILAEHYIRAKRMQQVYRDETNRVFDTVDIILTPGTPVLAPEIGSTQLITNGKSEPTGNAVTRFTSFFNLTGHPAISVPSGLSSSGLPMAVQLVAGHFEEVTLFRAASALEARFKLPLPPLAL